MCGTDTSQIWDKSGKRRTFPAHDGPITSLKWQPLQSEPTEDERLLVTGGEDGSIMVWNVRGTDTKPKFAITMPPPLAVNNLSLSPDGQFIAVATHDRVLVWQIDDHVLPKATWEPQPGWQSPNANGDTEDGIPCLDWDMEGNRLVYGLDNRVSDISMTSSVTGSC